TTLAAKCEACCRAGRKYWNFVIASVLTVFQRSHIDCPWRMTMKIRAGYEISYECPQPTPMILTLTVHPSRQPDLLTPDKMRLSPVVPSTEYRDGFGNICHVIRAP